MKVGMDMLSNEALRGLALGLLELSRSFLEEDKSLDPTAFIVTQKEHIPRPLDFQDETRKKESCRRIEEEAHEKCAEAIVTIFTARGKEFRGKAFDKQRYFGGKFESEGHPRCILLTVTGPKIRGWAVEVPFEQEDNKLVWGEPKEYNQEAVELGLFSNWPSEGDSKNTA